MREATSYPEQQPIRGQLFQEVGDDPMQITAPPETLTDDGAPMAEIAESLAGSQGFAEGKEPYPTHMTFSKMTHLRIHGTDEQVERALRGLMPVYRSLGGEELLFSEEDIAAFPDLRRTYLDMLQDDFRNIDTAYDSPIAENPWE